LSIGVLKVVIANVSDQKKGFRARFRLSGTSPRRFDAESGSIETVYRFRRLRDSTEVDLTLNAWGSIFIVFEPSVAPAVSSTNVSSITKITSDGATLEAEVEQNGEFFAHTKTSKLTGSVRDLPATLVLSGPWYLTIAGERAMKLEELVSWTQFPEFSKFSGTASYRGEFSLPDLYLRPHTQLELDLGEVQAIAEVVLNGVDAGAVWKHPYSLDVTHAAEAGLNQLEIRVTNRLINRQGIGLSEPAPTGEARTDPKALGFKHLTDGALQWTIGNPVFSQQFVFGQGRFSCASLLNRRTGREWIHPTESSDEFLIQIRQPKGQPVTLTGTEQWQYSNHSVDKVRAGWSELILDLKCTRLPVTVRRHYWWPERFPIVRQRTSITNETGEDLIIHRLDIFRLRLSPVPEALDLSWMNNFCRGMKPNPGNPIHHCSIDDNSQHYVRSGPYSPDCACFSLTTPHQREGLVGGWEWSGPMAVGFGDMQEPCLIHGGLDPEGMAEPLAPGKVFEGPVGWYGLFEGDLDEAAALSHDLIRTTLGPALPHQDYPWVGYCTWACSMDKDSPYNEKDSHPWFPSQQNLLSQVDAVSALGCELFLWDYGWFPQVGDWWCDRKRFPYGPKPIVQAVKRQGMKLGLWMGFGNADDTSKLIVEHPDWLATYGGRPIPDKFFTRTGASVWNTRIVCLAHRPAREWVKQQLSRVIEEFELDWLKHDFDLMTICQDENHTHTRGDSRIASCEAFYEIMDFIRRKYPQLLCENSMNNSAVPDYGVLQRHHVQLIGDSYRAFSLRQMFYGHSQIFPPDRQHRYLTLEDSEGEFENMLSGVARWADLRLC